MSGSALDRVVCGLGATVAVLGWHLDLVILKVSSSLMVP